MGQAACLGSPPLGQERPRATSNPTSQTGAQAKASLSALQQRLLQGTGKKKHPQTENVPGTLSARRKGHFKIMQKESNGF